MTQHPDAEIEVRHAAEALLAATSSGAVGAATLYISKICALTGPPPTQESQTVGNQPAHTAPEEKQSLQHGHDIDALQQLRLLAINISDPAGATPLLHAAKHGHAQLAELLLQAGASSSPQLHPSLNMPLHLACLHGHLDVVRALLSYKADANARNAAGDTPLMFACSGGHLAVALTLLHKFNADSMVSNRDGLSALMVASSAGAHLLVQALLKHQQGKGDEKVASMLGHRDAQGSTALHFAARNGHTECVRLLLSAGGISPDLTSVRNKAGCTALVEARLSGCREAVALLEAHSSHVPVAELMEEEDVTPQQHQEERNKRKGKTTPPPASVPPASAGAGAGPPPSAPSRSTAAEPLAVTAAAGAATEAPQASAGAAAAAAAGHPGHRHSPAAADPPSPASSTNSGATSGQVDTSISQTQAPVEPRSGKSIGTPGAASEPDPASTGQHSTQGPATTPPPGQQHVTEGSHTPTQASPEGGWQVMSSKHRGRGTTQHKQTAHHQLAPAGSAGAQWQGEPQQSPAEVDQGTLTAVADSTTKQSGHKPPPAAAAAAAAGGAAAGQGTWARRLQAPLPSPAASSGQPGATGSTQQDSTGLPPKSTRSEPGKPSVVQGAKPMPSSGSAPATHGSAGAASPPTVGIASHALLEPSTSTAEEQVGGVQGEGDEEDDNGWLAEAEAKLQEVCPAAAPLAVGIRHVLGLGLEALSDSQLDVLAEWHEYALQRVSELRAGLSHERERAATQEAARLEAEVAQLMRRLDIKRGQLAALGAA